MPRVSDLMINVPIEVFSILLFLFMIVPWFVKCKKKFCNIKLNRNVLYLIFGILFASIYFAIIAALGKNDIRIIQNIFIIIQFIHIIIIVDFMKLSQYKREDMMKVLLNLGLLQGVICIFMLIFPEYKKVALSLYYLGREENIFISRMRIYGISGDYTFFTPIYHGLLASVAFFYSIFKNKKYLLYIPFILITIFLNGRFGLVIFMISPVIAFTYFIFKGKLSIRMIKYSLMILLIMILGIAALRILSPYTFNWIVSGFIDTINLVFYGTKTGNYVVLADSMLYFPEGKKLFFGEGHRVYSDYGISRGYIPSDIGYVNDLFMGGIIYISILYGSIFAFLLKKNKTIISNISDIKINKVVSIFLVCALILANFKGECMRGGTILIGCFFIKYILMQNTYNVS